MSEEEATYTFPARIRKIWILRCVDVPREVSNAIRLAAGGKAQHVPVYGWIEGLAMRGTLVPGGGHYRLHVHSSIWRKLRIDAGAAVEVALTIDRERRETPVPPDLAAPLADEPRALAEFQAVSTALRRHIILFVEAAKQAKTRDKRIALVVRRMLERVAKKRKGLSKKEPRKKRAARGRRYRDRV